MIRLIAQGGLGNQLFMWNYAHELKVKHGIKVAIVFSKKNVIDREIFLQDIANYCSHNISIKHSSSFFWLLRNLDRASGKLPRLVSYIFKQFKVVTLQSPEEVLDTFAFTTLTVRGYFQNSNSVIENYRLYAMELESWLNNSVTSSTKETVSTYCNFNAVHVRRGDFEISKSTTGILSFEYFTQLTNPSVRTIVLTDDLLAIPKIKDSFPAALVLGPNEVSPPDAMYIMVNSKYLITSNSTFSWWAAVIGSDRIEKISMPKPWNLVQSNSTSYLELPFVNFAQAVFDE
jgi:hypothetical protein